MNKILELSKSHLSEALILLHNVVIFMTKWDWARSKSELFKYVMHYFAYQNRKIKLNKFLQLCYFLSNTPNPKFMEISVVHAEMCKNKRAENGKLLTRTLLYPYSLKAETMQQEFCKRHRLMDDVILCPFP